jgi:hypothetical protein
MSQPEDPNRPRSDSTPHIVWGLLGILVVAVFVLILSILRG